MAKDLSRFLQEVRFWVTGEDQDLRLDHFLVDKIFWRSRSDLQNRIKRGKVLVNGKPSKPAARLKKTDEVVVVVTPEDLPDQSPRDVPIDVLYENDAALVLNKQPGVLVHPIGRHVYDTVMNALHLRYQESSLTAITPQVVHRLDRDTSGVLVIAKTMDAKRQLQKIFQDHLPRKKYLAIVAGRIEADEGLIDAPLGPDEQAEIRLQICVRPDGLRALSRYQVLERFAAHSLVRVEIETGRQHQIRVHLKHLGHPILCDPLYGDPRSLGRRDEDPVIERQALHAERLDIEIPGEAAERSFEAPLPADMAALLAILRAGDEPYPSRDIQSSRWSRA